MRTSVIPPKVPNPSPKNLKYKKLQVSIEVSAYVLATNIPR